MKKMELKKGYTVKELNAFMTEVYSKGMRARRTADGGWETYDNPIDNEKKGEGTKGRKDEGKKVEAAEQPSDEAKPKKSLWKRLKDKLKIQ
jgi:hypothetical protein